MNILFDELRKKIRDIFVIGSASNTIAISENNNNNPSGLCRVCIKRSNQTDDIFCFSLDENNNSNCCPVYNIFNGTTINSTDAILLVLKGADIYCLHIELKSDNFDMQEIYKKYIFSTICVEHIIDILNLKLVFNNNISQYNKIVLNHRCILFSSRNSKERGSKRNIDYTEYMGVFHNQINKEMLFAKLNAKDNYSFYLEKFLA